jgi:cytochrome c-type biogenesis protein CcmF
MLGVGVFFYLLIVAPANPWHIVSPVPSDGPGPTPLLQNHILMGVHPPLLYLGYVGMTVPFGFAMGALIAGRLDDLWLRVTRRWTLIAWMFLSLAIIAGMWWSYAVLGWGGYWAWDPVENASFMPWLTATAFLHSSMVQERRSMLRVWNMSLVIATFLLTVLGTFLTRSGILSSVHAFTNGTIGVYFWTFIGSLLVLSLALLSGRSPGLRSRSRLDSMLSRETTFLFNNLLFTVFTFTVLLGTLFPLITEAVQNRKVSVAAPFFNMMTVPICVLLLFLMGVGPMLPWRTAKMERLKREAIPPFVGMFTALAIALVMHVRNPYGLLGFAFAGFALVANIEQFVLATATRRRATGGGFMSALWGVMNANPRRYGGYIAHLGVVVVALGITASSVFRTERDSTLKPGQTTEVAGYTLRFDSLFARREPHREVVGAAVTVSKGGRVLGVLVPRNNHYESRPDEAIATPGVRSTFRNDLYLVLTDYAAPNGPPGDHAVIKAIVQPWVSWIWFGGLIVAIGALFGAVKRRGERAVLDEEPIGPTAIPPIERTPIAAGAGV